MFLSLDFNQIKLRFKINSFGNSLEKGEKYGWTRISLSLQSRDLQYQIEDKEILEDLDIKYIFDRLELLLTGNLFRDEVLTFCEPDFRMHLIPALLARELNPHIADLSSNCEMVPLHVIWGINLWEEGRILTGHSIQLDLGYSLLEPLYCYLGYELNLFSIHTLAIQQFLQEGKLVLESENSHS